MTRLERQATTLLLQEAFAHLEYKEPTIYVDGSGVRKRWKRISVNGVFHLNKGNNKVIWDAIPSNHKITVHRNPSYRLISFDAMEILNTAMPIGRLKLAAKIIELKQKKG